MPTEFELEVWHRKAEKAYEALRSLPKGEQIDGIQALSEEIEEPSERKAFQHLVFGRLQSPETAAEATLTLDGLFRPESVAIIAFFLMLLLLIVELGLGFIWSLLFATVAAILVRLLLRSFDRTYMFRRFSGIWLLSGVGVLSGPTLVILVESQFGSLQWGGPPSTNAAALWCVGMITSAALAVFELRTHKN